YAAAQAIHDTDAKKATSTACEFMSGNPRGVGGAVPIFPSLNLPPTFVSGEALRRTTQVPAEVQWLALTCDHLVTYHSPCMTTTWSSRRSRIRRGDSCSTGSSRVTDARSRSWNRSWR